MRKISLLLFVTAFMLCRQTVSAQENFTWKEMNSFHSTAMLSFHGAEDGKLKPTRDSAAAMLQSVKTWQASAIPAGKNATAIKALLQTLADECTAINNAVVSKKTDDILKPLVLKAHHTFHEVIEKAK